MGSDWHTLWYGGQTLPKVHPLAVADRAESQWVQLPGARHEDAEHRIQDMECWAHQAALVIYETDRYVTHASVDGKGVDWFHRDPDERQMTRTEVWGLIRAVLTDLTGCHPVAAPHWVIEWVKSICDTALLVGMGDYEVDYGEVEQPKPDAY